MNDVRRFSLRRAIASLLVAAECFSLAAVGVPVSYAEEQILTTGQAEQRALSPGTEEEALIVEESAPVQEPAVVTPVEAARMGAETAEQLAQEAERAAEEAEQAAWDCAEADGDYELTLDAGARAAEAARRAQELAGRAKEEADWAAEAASIAAEEAAQAAQEAEILASEAQFAEELAFQTAEETDRLREEADLRIERINEIRSTAEPIDKTNKAEEKKSDKPDTKEKVTELVEETSITVITEKGTETISDFSLPAAQLEKEEEAAEIMLQWAVAEAERTKNEAAMKRADSEHAAENAARLAEEAEQASYASMNATDAANRAALAADRAAEANLYVSEAASVAAENEAARIAKLEQEKTSEEETVTETAAEEAKEETAEEAKEETTEEAKEETAEEAKEETAEEAKEETAEETKEETKEETGEEAREVETLDYSEGAVSVTGEAPAGTTVETADVTDNYADFDPSVYSALSLLEAPTFFDVESNTQRTTETRYQVLAAYDISLSVDGEKIQPSPGNPLEVSISDPAISDKLRLQVWHIRDDGTCEQIPEFTVEGESVRFLAESFSAYLVVKVTLSTIITAGDGNTYRVSVTYDQDAEMPENTDLAVRELGDDEKEDYVNQSAEALGTDAENLAFARAFDISLTDPDTGMEVQPASGVRVSVSLLDINLNSIEELRLLHFGEEVETVSYTLNGSAVEFETDGFSVYVLAGYTVDFHWGDYTYSIAGESEILLSALLEKLGVTEITAADVAEVAFSDSALVEVEAIKDEAEQTTDWRLRSLAPFSTEEKLTLTLKNGRSVEIKVTDTDDDPVITPPTAKEGLVYTGKAQELVTAGSAEGGTMKYRLGEEGEYSPDLPTATASGEYTVYYIVEDDATHNILDTQNLTVTIAKAPVTVTADAAGKTYGEDDPELTATVEGLVGEDTIEYTVTRAEGENAGAYTVTVLGDAEQGNYVVHYVAGVFTVAQRELTITAANDSKVYDGYELSSEEFTVEGLIEGHAVQSVVHEGGLTDVGTYPHAIRDAVIVNPAVTDPEGNPEIVTENYVIHYILGTLEVTRKPITITATSAEKVYDGTALTEAGYTSTGLADGDVFDGITITGSQTQVGESANVPSDVKIVRPAEDGSIVDVNGNYDITYANGTLKVTAQILTITADSATKVYDGKALTKESYTVEGLAEGDSIQSVTVTGSQTDAGVSDNVPSGAEIVNADGKDISDSYTVSYKNGSLKVTKKPIKLTAASGVEVYDGREKTLSGFTASADGRTLSGITFADTVSASVTGTEKGDYTVTFSGVTLNETTDTTGNYLVTETENGVLRIAESAPIEKALTASGNEAFYEIVVNPEGLPLNGGQSLTLKDTFTNNQSIDYSSVIVIPDNVYVPYDYSQETGTYTIPDETSVTITYKTRISGEAGSEVTFGNTAQLGVMQNGSFTPLSSATVSMTHTITPSGADIEGTGGNYMIKLFTYAQSHMEEGLGGAVYRLLDSNQRPIAYRAGEHTGEIITFTTGDNGYVDVAVDDGIISLHKNTIYYLEMITAPVQRHEDGSYTYYQKDNTLYSFVITDNPSYSAGSGAYAYFNGDVLKVRCYPESAGVNVTKRFSGNYTLTDAQKNQIRFTLQKEDLATESWVTVESHTYAEFSYGSLNFNTGRTGGPPLEPAVLYRLIEENEVIPEADCTSAVILNYQRDNQPVQENTNEFEVNPDHSTYSFSLVFDNTYVDHKLTVVKLNELTGVLLPGAEFTVYKALDDSEVKTYPTIGEGVLEIRRNDEGANYAPNTAYYVEETTPPTGYLMPKNPERIYFYFSEDGSGVPEGIPVGMTAVDLTSSYDAIVVNNNTEAVKVPVTVTWSVDGSNEWPADVGPLEIGLYQSVNGEDPVPVYMADGITPMTVTLDRNNTFDNTTFVDLPARDEFGNDITYSIRQELPGYYTSYKVSGTGWYVVRNESAVSVTVTKEWYGLDGQPAAAREDVAFDLYCTTADHPEITTRDGLEAILRGLEPVRTGLTLSADSGWTNTVSSLQKQDSNGNLYYYFALEREDSMPSNSEDSYAVTPADGGNLRTLTVKNTQTPITVIIRADDLTKEYGHGNPEFSFYTEVQDDDCEVSEPVPVPGEDGKYTVTVTDGSGNPKTITFTCAREKQGTDEGEDVGSYAIKLSGEASQGGYRVRLDDGELTITPAQVTVKGTATKVYGDPDPALVEITGVKEGETISYYAYRDIGEQKGSYRITVTGMEKQGNYEITYINGYLTIEPAPVTVTADNISKPYGAADPALTVTMDGLKNNDATSVIKYVISRSKQGTEEGESVGEYDITLTGDENQGNYTVTFKPGTFTITGHKVTVRAKNIMKTYGDADPTWEAEVTGLNEGETLEYTFSRTEGEDVGTYVVTPAGEAAQGNAEVTYETGILTINKANLTVTPENLIKALTDPITPDPQLTVSFEGMADRDKEIVPQAEFESGTWTYTYTRQGKTEPEFGFTITRTPGETAGPYIIAATAYGERPKNYNVTYKTGIFTILTTYNVVLTQQTRDLVDYTQNPEYTYKAVLDPEAIGIEEYNAGGFVDNVMTFTLPAGESSSKTLPIPSGAKLTVTQETTNPDYTTAITLDTEDVEGTSIEINPVNKAAAIVVTHERITLPVEARAAQSQTESGTAVEDGAAPVTPLAYLGIPRDAEKNPISQPADGENGFIHALDAQDVYNLPEDMYYVPEHASVYNGDTAVATNVQAIKYDEENKAWQYSTDGAAFDAFASGDQLELFYMPKYICRVQADRQPYYTLKEALNHIRDTQNGTGVIEMLLDSYTIPASDNLSIPAGYDITLTTATEVEGLDTAVILRKPNNLDHMFTNAGTLTLDNVILDGNKERVTANNAMVLNNGALTVKANATLRNASGNNGGAIYANSGSVIVDAGASITGNTATNGGAIYLHDGSLSIAAENNTITGNTATNGGAVFIAGGTFEQTNSITGNTATNGGAVYVSGGTLTIRGTVSGTAASGGAVFMIGGTVDVTGGTVSGSPAENGGAFYMEGGTLKMSGGTVSGNTAQSSGGMLYATGGTVTVSGGTVSGNTAENGSGGAIYYAGPGTVTVSGGTLSGNKAENGLGGAIYQASGETMLSAGNINGENKAINGAAVYTAGGIANFTGVSITGNTASEGGAVGMAAGTKLNFSGNTKVSDNKNTDGENRNVYLNVDSDEIINVPANLGSNNIGIYVADNVRSTRGEACCSFGGYVSTTNLAKITDDRGIYTEYSYNNKLYWGKAITFRVRYLPTGFPTSISSGNSLVDDTSFYPRKTEYSIYELVATLQNEYYNNKINTQVYSYTFANGFNEFANQITSIGWDSTNRRWVLRQHDGNTSNETKIAIFYGDAAFISITNNTGHDLTINPLTVMGMTAVDDGYGYTTAINNVTQNELLAVTQEHLTIPADASVRLLFPGAKNAAWSMQGTFDGVGEGETISYTLNKPGGGTEQSLEHQSGAFTLSGTTLNESGAIYEILFGAAKPICKVMHNGVEHPFETLTLAKNYIVANTLTTATIEMLQDYQQPKTDILVIPEGYDITLTTAKTQAEAEAAGETYYYVGENASSATISRSSGDMSAAVRADINAGSLVTWDDTETGAHATTSLTVHHIIFDGKALGQGGEGGAIKTANVKVYVHHCGFKGYNADFGGALYTKWGQLTVEDCDFNKCQARGGVDKTGGGGIWTTAQKLTVDNCTFTDCSCLESPAQGGAVFHNIRKDNSVVSPRDSQRFPTGFSNKSETHISNCVFHDCVAKLGSGGTIESDAKIVTIEYCEFYGSEAHKVNGANGGAINIYTNDNSPQADSSLTVTGCYFKDCNAYSASGTKNSHGGVIRTICKNVSLIDSVFINSYADNQGGVLSMTTVGNNLLIQGCTIDTSSAVTDSGAIYANATNVTIIDSTFTNCKAPSYGGVYHNATGELKVIDSSFEDCQSNVSVGGALYTKTQKLTISGMYGGKSITFPVSGFTTTYSAKYFTFKNCTANKDGGAVYNNDSNGSQVLTNCVFDGCTSGTNGGGAYLAAKSLSVSGTTVQNCEAVNNGGGIYTGTGATGAVFTDCTFTNNRVTASEGKGGALFHNTNGLTFNGELTGNYAAYGGGIYHNAGTFNLNDSQLSECNATKSGGGIYSRNTININNTEISDCYAVTSGGGIYHTGNLYPYGTITKCYAPQGGGVYSAGYIGITDASKKMLITDCHAAKVTIADDGTATAEEEYTSENQGGGIYKSGGNWDLKSEQATISGCSAYDGGGVFWNGGTLSFSNGNFIANKATNNGGAIYKNGGSATMSGGVIGGSAENANHAQYGSAIFVADSQTITLGSGRITHNVAEAGGAVAAGGTNTQLLFQGAPVIRNNTNANGDKCNVYLNYDTNGIIRTSSNALTGGAYIGVYVNEEQFGKHGNYTLPFGTYGNEKGLGSFFNDRIYAGGLKGSSFNQIVWGKFVCKITDADGNLLYTDTNCEAPAVYTKVENDGAADTTSAFGMLSNSTVNLYNANGRYSGAYQIQMLVGDYDCKGQMKIANGSKDVTLTTASRTPDECGFCYTGTAEQAVIRRAAQYGSMINTTNLSRLVIESITVDGGSENGFKSNSNGGILFITNGTKVYLNENATLCNSELNKGCNGGAVRMQDGALSYLYINGGEIKNCVAKDNNNNTGYGGAISAKNGDITMNSGLITECIAEGGGGAVVVEKNMYMNGGTITGNNATKYGGGIELKGKIYFTGNPVISGNTLNNSTPCNLQLMNNNNNYIYTNGLGPFAEIRVYTDSEEGKTNHQIYNGRGVEGKAFGTWTDNVNLHCFINDITPALRGMKTENEHDYAIYWRTNPFLSVGKFVESDWAADKDVLFNFTVTLSDETFTKNLENMNFVDGVAEFTLKAGQVRTASDFPIDFIQEGVNYTVTETLAEGQTAYTTQYSHNGGDAVTGTTVTGQFGENMNADPLLSSSASSVIFTNTRAKDDLTVSKTVTEGSTGDNTMPFTFTVTLDDDTISKTYRAKRYQDQTDVTGTDETVTFTDGVAKFALIHGQAIKILGLPTELGFKVEENLTDDQYANFRTYVTEYDSKETPVKEGEVPSKEETLSYSATGKIGELKQVAFRNNRFGLVCKIVTSPDRQQLYYRANNDPDVDPTPAIFDELEKAFETINIGTVFFTDDGSIVSVKSNMVRVEMVKSHYEMNRQAVLANGYNVTLGTAQKTDRLYPYPTDADGFAVVTRGYDGGSMIADNGNLSIDNITLDGGRDTHTADSNGGIVQVNGAQNLTVTERATLRNSVSSGNGGAIWIGENAALTMNGTITDCEAAYGGGVYAAENFGGGLTGVAGISIGGTISDCTAAAGNGGALYVGTAASTVSGVPLVLTGSATLSGNEAISADGVDNSGCGGALYCATAVEINSADVDISGNTSDNDGGGIYQSTDSTFTMSGGTISNNTATTGNGGGIWANNIAITGGSFSDNKAENGTGGAIHTKTSSRVTIEGENTSFNNNVAKRGGAVYDQAASFTMSAGSMTDNTATEKGGAVYVAAGCSFTMGGGRISGNSSPEGAISTGSGAVLNFSGNASVTGNTNGNDSETVIMNVFLGYHSNTIINASGLTGADHIGVYVTDGEDKIIYNNHGIANRPFGTGSGDNLSKFINDRDNSLTGVQGPDGLIMWPGKDLLIQVYQNKANAEGQKTTPVGGAKFSLSAEKTVTTDDPDNPTTTASVILWTGDSDSNGLVTIPWGIMEEENGNKATFTKKGDDGNVTKVTYILSEQQANSDTVRPAGTWKLTIALDNAVTWEVITPKEETSGETQGGEGQETPAEPEERKNVNRTINLKPEEDHYIGETFILYNDVKPKITFDPNGGILSGKTDESTRTDTINFSPTDLNHTYKIEEPNPTRENAVFRIWSTVKNPVEGDGHKEYKLGNELLFYRSKNKDEDCIRSDNDDLTLYALWSTVVCKITDREDNLLYVNGSPAVYMSLKEGFDDFNTAALTYKDGTKATPRKIKMLVSDYEMTETVELARGKICEFMTAPNTDTDGYKGPDRTCVITRATSFDSGSMLIDNYNLVLREITLDGAVKDSSNTVKTMDGNGGIVTVRGNSSQLTLATGATLRNADVNGNGGAIYAHGNTVVNVSNGIINGCKATNGGAIYADNVDENGQKTDSATVNINGGEISGNTAKATGEKAQSRGGAVYATGTVNFSGGDVKNNKAEAESKLAYGGGLYLTADAELAMTGGSLSANSAVSGGGVYSDGSVILSNASAVISGNNASGNGDGNNASGNGGGIYVSESGSLSLTAGSIGASGSPNTAASGSGVYLAGKATLTGGSISYNGTETGNGGGLYLGTKSEITLNGTELSHNQAANGGAVYAVKPENEEGEEEKTVTLTLAKGTLSHNTASANGGGLYIAENVTLKMTGGALNTNTAANGGGAYAASGSTMTLSGGALDTNSAQNGGGAYAASGSTMTLSGGTVSANSAKHSGTDNTTGNGAGVYVEGDSETSYAVLNVVNGSVIDNKADTFGGAVYLHGHGRLRVSGGTISTNSAGNDNGGAINAEGTDARIYLYDTPTIFNNPGDAQTTAQKNLVLSVNQNTIINTDENGLDVKKTNGTTRAAPNVSGIVGIYVIDDNNVYEDHGVYDKPFGTFGDTDDNRINAKNLVNDRNLGLYGVKKEDNDNTIYWLDVVCKVTNTSNELLYKRVNVDESGVYVYVPAVYASLKEGFEAISGSLYRKSGSRYAVDNTGSVWVQMLKDYTLNENEIISYEGQRSVRLKTADAEITDIMSSTGDRFVYKPDQNAEGERLTKATLTRAQSSSSMFTVNTPTHNFNVYDIIIDGGSNTMMTEPNVDGGAFNFQSVRNSTFSRVTLKNLNATRNGGAIYLNSGNLTLTSTNDDYGNTRVIGSAAANGGAIYVNSGSLTLTGTSSSVNGNTMANGNTAVYGGAIYVNSGTLTINRYSILTDNTAEQDGGVVYVNAGVSATLGNSTINHNTATNGAGFYLAAESTLNLAAGAPDFGGTDRKGGNGTDKDDLMGTEGNFVRRNASFKTEDKEPTNGGKQYPKDGEDYLVRQDIYVEGTGEPLTSIHVTGRLTTTAGGIWVWADNQNHYEMLKQFAVFTGTGATQNNNRKEVAMKAFRNAQPDSLTNCGGDYLTGQKGEAINGWECIYWTGGFNVVFKKIDGYGKPLPGATFTLYSDPACTTPFEMTFTGSTPVTGDGKRATTVSSDGTATYKDKNGSIVTLEKGEVLLSKVPPKTFYLKETVVPAKDPEGKDHIYKLDETIYEVKISGTGELEMHKKSSSTATSYDVEVFKVKTSTDPAPEVWQYQVMNVSEAERKVILRKVADGNYTAIPDKEFKIYSVDGTEKASGTSLSSGVFWIGKLPFGTYYLHETSPDKWFTLTVGKDKVDGSRDGVSITTLSQAPAWYKTSTQAQQ